jgi:hypothetical protein
MKIFILAALLLSNSVYAGIDYVSVKECRSLLLGRLTEGNHQETLNKKLKAALVKANAKRLNYIQYGTEQGFFRDKDNGCIIATAWFEN